MIFYKKNKKRIKIFWAKDKLKKNLNYLKKLFKNKNVYITFDVDSFDSMYYASNRNTRTVFNVGRRNSIIKKVCNISNVIGADINELSPIKNFDSYNF